MTTTSRKNRQCGNWIVIDDYRKYNNTNSTNTPIQTAPEKGFIAIRTQST